MSDREYLGIIALELTILVIGLGFVVVSLRGSKEKIDETVDAVKENPIIKFFSGGRSK